MRRRQPDECAGPSLGDDRSASGGCGATSRAGSPTRCTSTRTACRSSRLAERGDRLRPAQPLAVRLLPDQLPADPRGAPRSRASRTASPTVVVPAAAADDVAAREPAGTAAPVLVAEARRGRPPAAGELLEGRAGSALPPRAGPRLLSNRRSRLAVARPGTEQPAGDRAACARSRAAGISRPRSRSSADASSAVRRGRLSAFAYSVHDAPSDLKKLLTYRFNREDLLFNIGRVIDLPGFLSSHRTLGESRLARRLNNSLQRELAQERAVWGPLLLPRHAIAERVFEAARWRGRSRRWRRTAASRSVLWREARGYFWEIAANPNGFAFGIIEVLFKQIWRRMFSGVEVRGLERVVECVKQHPVVLVPCHRSHFDYMVLSHLPRALVAAAHRCRASISRSGRELAAARIGRVLHPALVRGQRGHKLVFHRYLTTMIRQGYTPEFFIEGRTQPTGKILTPKLGMLGGIVRAFFRRRPPRPLPGAGVDPLRTHRERRARTTPSCRAEEAEGVVRRAAENAQRAEAAALERCTSALRSDVAAASATLGDAWDASRKARTIRWCRRSSGLRAEARLPHPARGERGCGGRRDLACRRRCCCRARAARAASTSSRSRRARCRSCCAGAVRIHAVARAQPRPGELR